jgi:CHAT domain-containing protein
MRGRLKKFRTNILFKLFSFSAALILNYPVPAAEYLWSDENTEWLDSLVSESYFQSFLSQDNTLLKNSNAALELFINKGEIRRSGILVDKIEKLIKVNPGIDSSILAESYYLMGIYFSTSGNMKESLKYLSAAGDMLKNKNEERALYAKIIFNTGLVFGNMGESNKLAEYSLKYINVAEQLYGDTSRILIKGYASLVSAYIQMHQYEKAISTAGAGVNIANRLGKGQTPPELITLYNAIGVCYVGMADYNRAINYLEKTEYLYSSLKPVHDENYINLLNSLAVTYGFLGLKEKSMEYYEKGIELAESINSFMSFNLVNSYAIELGNDGKENIGEALLARSLEKAERTFGKSTRSYVEVLKNYAEYLREYDIDKQKALSYFEQCTTYVEENKWDIVLKYNILIGYAIALKDNGYTDKALEILQELLFAFSDAAGNHGLYENPSPDKLNPDKYSLKILRTKYDVLQHILKEKSDLKILLATAGTSELIISVLERVRLNISEEESRLILGDKYRVSYLNAIRDFNQCYLKTGNTLFFEKAYEYTEKSKVAGLLASTRELRAAQFHIPPEKADSVNYLLREISLINSRIAEENAKPMRDNKLLSFYNDQIIKTSQKRDRLIKYFETNYPEYYAIKYNTQIVKMTDIEEAIGRSSNYLNYVVSDSLLYIFLVNRKYKQLLSFRTDSSFTGKIMEFKNILSSPSFDSNAKEEFMRFQELGYELYKILLEPVMQFLISDRLVISPDNVLSYLPFETLLTRNTLEEDLLYRDLPYVLQDLNISYTYSVTLMSESLKKGWSFKNKLIAFAPDYPKQINIDSLLSIRQGSQQTLSDLPFARQEAKYVADLLKGDLYINNQALESSYKARAGSYDIIHLSMHTLLNDMFPMSSKMIFYQVGDPEDDGYLNTYEIYSIPLKSKMVVLSSCNTGSGMLYTGEGILSLARGFIYAGSESVVMSLWEVDDKSGTDIMKLFYGYLKKGYTKSEALRKARIEFLKNSDQLRSLPYFWSTLIVYGNNKALFSSVIFAVILLITSGCMIAIMLFYLLKRRNSLYS